MSTRPMPMKLELGSILLLVSLAGCATTSTCPDAPTPTVVPGGDSGASGEPGSDEPGSDEPSQPATVVIFVRHAEKAADGTPDPPLTERGQRRAECLGTLLRPFAPDHLLTSEYQRTQATLAPLAQATGQTPAVIEAGDQEAWATALRELPPGSHVVVAGHSNTVPVWAASLGAQVPDLDDKGNIPDDDYDRMIQVVVDGRGHMVTSFTTAYCVEPGPSS